MDTVKSFFGKFSIEWLAMNGLRTREVQLLKLIMIYYQVNTTTTIELLAESHPEETLCFTQSSSAHNGNVLVKII